MPPSVRAPPVPDPADESGATKVEVRVVTAVAGEMGKSARVGNTGAMGDRDSRPNKPLPMPVRIAAGLVATAFEQAKDLPRTVVELPVTAVSQALQASMRVQQKVTELAIKGDRVLGVGPQIEDEPAWATFDDDVPPPPRRNIRTAAAPAAPATVSRLRPAPDLAPSDRPAPALATDGPAPDPFDEPGPIDPGSVDPEPVTEPGTSGSADAATDTADGPSVLPGYDALTIPQLRGKLRNLGLDDLRLLLAWEETHGDRPPYVTMLTNRIATVSAGVTEQG